MQTGAIIFVLSSNKLSQSCKDSDQIPLKTRSERGAMTLSLWLVIDDGNLETKIGLTDQHASKKDSTNV